MNVFARKRITFVTTERCNAECAHCLMECGPGKKKSLRFEQMRDIIDAYRAEHELYQVIFTGGEPTLLGDDLLDTIAYCASLGVMSRMVTNCFWARDDKTAGELLHRLRSAGLDELNISLDDYHARYVPVENVLRVWELTKDMDFSSVVLANCSEPGGTYTPERVLQLIGESIDLFDRREGKIPDIVFPGGNGTTRLLSCTSLQKTGRAAMELKDAPSWQIDAKNLIGGCTEAGSDVCVSYDHHLWMCCGIRCEGKPVFDFGSLDEQSLSLCAERAEDSVLVNAFRTMGPELIAEFLMKCFSGFSFPDHYHNSCEICAAILGNERAVNVLRENTGYLYSLIRQIQEKKRS